MKAEILNLLNEDARMSLNDLALRTGATPEQVKERSLLSKTRV